MTEDVGSTPHGEEREFEDLTLAEMLGDLLRQPFETLRILALVTSPSRAVRRVRVRRPLPETEAPSRARTATERLALARAGLFGCAVVAAWIGNLTLVDPNPGQRLGLLRDVPLTAAIFFWLLSVALVIAVMRFLRDDDQDDGDFTWYELSAAEGVRPLWLIAAVPLLTTAFVLSAGNAFTLPGTAAWFAGIFATAWGFAPRGVSPLRAIQRGVGSLRRFRIERPRLALLLAIVLIVGAYARFNGIESVPAEMTSDHIEKLLDSQRVANGARDIFFANNGGREPFQMYLLALMSEISGTQLGFMHLKILTAVESLVGVALLFVLGREAAGVRDWRLGIMLGLVLALFAAVGYWHLSITRVSLRIMLTPLVTTVFLIYLLRFIRFNRREDAIMLGLTIGVGLYAYQALRMLPVVAAAAVLYIAIFVARDWRQRWGAALNLLVMATVAFAVFVPLFKYSTEHPEEFWRRAQGRLLGEDVITETRPDGTIVNRSPTLVERAAALVANLPALGQNMARAFGMFTYRGDIAWLHNAPNYPAFDPLMGGFLIAGTAAWVIWAVQQREHAALFLIAVLVLMLVPSAVAIANPIENPSNTRTSGAMPVAYLLAAFGAVQLLVAQGAVFHRYKNAVAIVIVGIAAVLSLGWANSVLFGPYDDYYQNSWSPQREAGLFMRGFAESDGAWGNIFIFSAAHFFDYRGVALEAGLAPGEFTNGDMEPHQLAGRMYAGYERADKFRYDPSRYTMVIYSLTDVEAKASLELWFPEGRDMVIDTRLDTPWLYNEQYRAYRIPPMSESRLREFFQTQGLDIRIGE